MGLFDRFRKDGRAPDALTREALARLRALPGVTDISTTDADTLQVSWHGGSAVTVDLTALRAGWENRSGMERIDAMDEFLNGLDTAPAPSSTRGVTGLVDPGIAPTHEGASGAPTGNASTPNLGNPTAAWHAVADQLVPRIRRADQVAPDTVSWAVTDDLHAVVVVDGGPDMATTTLDLADWGVDLPTALAAAQANLGALDPALDSISPGAAAWVPSGPEGNLSMWLAAGDQLIAAAAVPRLVALVPLRSELVVVDPTAADVLADVLVGTRQIVEAESNVLWPTPLLIEPGRVTAWVPDADHPCADLVAHMR